MSAAVAGRPAASARKGGAAHRWAITFCAFCALALVAGIFVHGFRYYTSPAPARAVSPLHRELKPGGSVGHALGMLGATLFLLVYLYPLRKRWKWLSKKGKTKNWLDYHILMGLTAPLIVTLHSSFKLSGIAGLSYRIMLSVVASGIVGRYLYSRIPRRLDQAEMSREEMEALRRELASQIESEDLVAAEELKRLLSLPSIAGTEAMPLGRALLAIMRFDLRRYALLWRLRWSLRKHVADHAALKRVLAVVRKETALARDIAFLARMQEMFRLWHVVHRPFSYSFAVLVVLHILVVTMLGYF